MRNFKGIIMSEYTSKLTILRHFPKIFSMIHMPPKPIAATLFLCKKLTFQIKIYSQTRVYSIFSKFSRGNIGYMPPKPLAINHRAALSLFHR